MKRYPNLKNSFDDTSLLAYTDDIATYMMKGQKNNKMKGPIRVVHISDLRHIDGYKLHVLRQLTGIPKNKVYQEIIDLTCDDEIDPYLLGEKMRIVSSLPIFGVLDKFNRSKQNRAKDCGFDLVFTKSMLLRSIKEIVIHISNEE